MSRKMKVRNIMYTVITETEYNSNRGLYDEMIGTIAVEVNGYIYPLVRRAEDFGYCRRDEHITKFYVPDDIKEDYNACNVIDYNKAENMTQYIKMINEYHNQEYQVLITPDNIFSPQIKHDDTPQMKGLKAAIIKKHIDFDKYQERIGATFQNDKRLFNHGNITFPKLINVAKALDLKVTMVFEDAGTNIANPMNDKIIVDITGGGNIIYEK